MKHYMGFLSRRMRERQVAALKRQADRLQKELKHLAFSEWNAEKLRQREQRRLAEEEAKANRSWVQKLADRLFSLPSLRWW